MFANYDYSKFPLVYVDMSGSINSDTDFEHFKNGWLSCYDRQEKWTFIFNTTNVGYVNVKYSFKTANFIKQLKKKSSEEQYLEKSLIYVSNKTVDFLLRIIFYLTPPVAPVYLIYNNDEEYIATLLDKINNGDKVEKPVKVFMP